MHGTLDKATGRFTSTVWAPPRLSLSHFSISFPLVCYACSPRTEVLATSFCGELADSSAWLRYVRSGPPRQQGQE